jgi:hypothetical protein
MHEKKKKMPTRAEPDTSADKVAVMIHQRHAIGTLRTMVRTRGLVVTTNFAPPRGVQEIAVHHRKLSFDVSFPNVEATTDVDEQATQIVVPQQERSVRKD